jgi:hypothetical protein
MYSCRSAGLWTVILVASMLAGCSPMQGAEQKVPAARATADGIRQEYQRINPANRVGVVIAVLPKENLAAVGDIAIADFALGDTLVFMDTSEKPLKYYGTVVNIVDNALHLKYAKRESGGREPRVGDLAVRVVQTPAVGQP